MKYFKFLLSPVFMGVLFVAFALSMAVATFLENGLGSAAAYSMVYDTRWFELILLLLSVNMIGQVVVMRLLRKEKLTIGLFHLAFVLMIIGAGITRYFGWEGSMHIREGEEQKQCYSNDKYIQYSVKNNEGKTIADKSLKYSMTTTAADKFEKSFNIKGEKYKLILARVIPNAVQTIANSPDGEPMVSFVVSRAMMDRKVLVLKKGEVKSAGGITFSFSADQPGDINISVDSGKFFITSIQDLVLSGMSTGSGVNSQKGVPVELKRMQIFSLDEVRIVPQNMSVNGVVRPEPVKSDQLATETTAFVFHFINGMKSSTVYLWDGEGLNATDSCSLDGNKVKISYGPEISTLPFSVKLNDFILERYPGSASPSGYKSDVVIIDTKENVQKPFMIFMNNILKYKGYRFYQSSYDKDEKGTLLSVNHDMEGMVVTYTGYGLLFLFIIMSLLNRNSVFRNVTPSHWNSLMRKTLPAILIILLLSGTFNTLEAQKQVADKSASMEFGKVLVQDQKGRTKPLFTLSNDILRKVTKENTFNGLTSMQVFLGLHFNFDEWKNVPLIRISDNDLQKKLGITGKYAAFSDLVDLENNGTYKISGEVNAAYSKAPADRSKTDKEVMKVDERVNIIYMIYKGDFLKLFPLKDGSHTWVTAEEAVLKAAGKEDSLYLKSVLPFLGNALQTNNSATVAQLSESLRIYQKKYSQYALPTDSKTNAELLYDKLSVFERIFPFYATIGLIMLIGLIIGVIRGRETASKLNNILKLLLIAGFLFHTFALGMRWYIAGHAPMSNGYESMVFISWATLLAGFIFSRKSAFVLSASAVLASMTLMVAHMSFMDPEITNLVPVLKSYWLTLHVSVIISSYGFLGVGAILSLIILILLCLSNNANRQRISDTIDGLTVLNFQIQTIGLYLLTIGTFLGAVWANESWGRYWGWDPKETWSLITIIIYSIVIHSRRIPGMKDIYTFNLISLFAFSSVLMTYFGVNYYLSGMHSYASGEAASVPVYTYIIVILLAVLSLFAYTKYTSKK